MLILLMLRVLTVANSNIVALSATLIVRLILGPLVDRFGRESSVERQVD